MSAIKAMAGGYRPVILAVIVLTQAAAAAPTQAVPVLAPFYQVELGLSWTQVGLFMAAISFGQMSTALAGGFVTDYLGVRRMFLIGPLLMGAFIAALSVTPSFGVALVLGFVTGLGVSVTSPGASKVVLNWFSPANRASVMGIKQTGLPICGGLAAATLPALALLVGWRYAALAVGVTVAVSGIAVFAAYREPEESQRSASNERFGWSGLKEVALNRDLWLTGIFGLGLVGAQFSIATYLIFYFRDVFAVSVTVAGAYLALAQVSGLVGRVGLGLVSDLLLGSRRKPVLATCSFLAAGMLTTLAFSGPFLPQAAILGLLVALGVCLLGFHGVWVTLLCELGGADKAGTAAGLGSTFSMAGAALAPMLFGVIMDATQSYQIAWGASAVLVAATSVAFLLMREDRRRA